MYDIRWYKATQHNSHETALLQLCDGGVLATGFMSHETLELTQRSILAHQQGSWLQSIE